MRPMYPGALPAGAMSSIIERNIPIRFGLVPLAETEEGAWFPFNILAPAHDNLFTGKKMTKLFYHLIKNYGRKKTLDFLSAVRHSNW
jgi:UDP-glucose:glycoprotein glucosyltransferase